MSVLKQILERKRDEVAQLEQKPGRASLQRSAEQAPAVRSFHQALRGGASPRVIAEFKRASPSKGPIRTDADPAEIARAYAAAGAAISLLQAETAFFSHQTGAVSRQDNPAG